MVKRSQNADQQSNAVTKNPGGRPPHGMSAKRASISIKVGQDLRDFLDDEARRNGQSFTLEVEKRLVASRLLDRVDGSEAVSPFISVMIATLSEIDVAMGRSWRCDAEGLAVAQGAMLKIMRSFGTPADASDLRKSGASTALDHEFVSSINEYADRLAHCSALGERTAARIIETHRALTGVSG